MKSAFALNVNETLPALDEIQVSLTLTSSTFASQRHAAWASVWTVSWIAIGSVAHASMTYVSMGASISDAPSIIAAIREHHDQWKRNAAG